MDLKTPALFELMPGSLGNLGKQGNLGNLDNLGNVANLYFHAREKLKKTNAFKLPFTYYYDEAPVFYTYFVVIEKN